VHGDQGHLFNHSLYTSALMHPVMTSLGVLSAGLLLAGLITGRGNGHARGEGLARGHAAAARRRAARALS